MGFFPWMERLDCFRIRRCTRIDRRFAGLLCFLCDTRRRRPQLWRSLQRIPLGFLASARLAMALRTSR